MKILTQQQQQQQQQQDLQQEQQQQQEKLAEVIFISGNSPKFSNEFQHIVRYNTKLISVTNFVSIK